jgi:hypothetical protein
MKANQLRIGNLVQVNNETVEVLWFDHEGAVCQTLDHKAQVDMPIEPIPLTEDILLKCGFKRDNKYDFTLKVKDVGDFYTSSEWFHGNGYITFEHFGIKLFYLHQLQNLYFALTEEELTIKP